ncbi:metallophosphoesterase family protein [Haloarchaeobius sp. TZWWS8]|uniref:metallophosphoesterase family protein n=1 Tax=Haloarchaeobius sp. TZWWS8 TaxID=3446121 RepID=UPI003EB79A9F
MTPPRFGDAVSRQHRRISREDWRDVYVIGDVHGCRETLDALLAELGSDERDLHVFVGDLVTRGPDSAGVVDVVREAPNMLSVRGNNEQKVLDGTADTPDLDDCHRQWLASLPVALSWDDVLVVHGGIDPRKPLASHVPQDLMETGSLAGSGEGRPYWWELYNGPHRVCFGHRVFSSALIGEHAIGLDTGCVYGNRLTAFDCSRDRTVSVESEGCFRERDPSDFIDPSSFA